MFLALIPFFTLSLTADHFEDSHAEDYSPRNISVKAKLLRSQSLVGDIFWIIIEEDRGTIVVSSQKGIIVIRFEFQDHEKCYDKQNTFCLKAALTETKNTYFTKVGDEATIILEYPNKLTFSILSGELVTNTFELEIEKLRKINIPTDLN